MQKKEGVFIDIAGASTNIIITSDKKKEKKSSLFPNGSLPSVQRKGELHSGSIHWSL